MLPPYMALSIYLFALTILLVGLAFGWAWGVAAMAAGLRARDQVLYAQQLQTQEAGYVLHDVCAQSIIDGLN